MLGFSPISVFPISALDESIRSYFRAEVTANSNPSFIVYFSSEEFITGASDVPANTPIEGCLVSALNYQRSIIGGDYGLGRFQSGFGTMEIVASDGAKDDLFDRYRPDGGRVAMRIMASDGLLSTSFLAFDGIGVRWAINRDRGSITVKDNSFKLDVPAQRSVYAGTGGLEGGTDLAGKRRPWPLGYVKNIPGAAVIPTENLYDVGSGRIQAVTACRDRGAALTLHADYATTVLLRGASIPDAKFGTCLADGRVKIGGNPSSQIRFDIEGDKTGGIFVFTTADIIERVIDAATTMIVPDGIVTSTFDWVNAVQPAPVGYYVGPDSTDTVAELTDRLMSPIGGWGGCRAQGKFEIGILLAPDDDEVPSFIYNDDDGDILSIDRQPLPDFLTPPPTSWRLAYDRNWARQDDIAGLAIATDPDLASWLAKDTRYALPSSPTTLTSGQKPNEVTAESFFRNEADAIAEADRRLILFRQNFNLYIYRVKDHIFMHEIGRGVRVHHPRFNLANGRPLRNVSINDNTDDNAVEIVGFG